MGLEVLSCHSPFIVVCQFFVSPVTFCNNIFQELYYFFGVFYTHSLVPKAKNVVWSHDLCSFVVQTGHAYFSDFLKRLLQYYFICNQLSVLFLSQCSVTHTTYSTQEIIILYLLYTRLVSKQFSLNHLLRIILKFSYRSVN